MGVESYLELYTTYMGWLLYDIGWTFVADFGLVHAAALALLFTTWNEAVKRSYAHKPAAPQALQQTTWQMIWLILVVSVFGIPSISLQAHVLKFVPPPTLSNPNPGAVERGQTGTTYDNTQLADVGDQKIPLGWATIMALTAGVNNVVRKKLPPQQDLRAIQMAAETTHIDDPALRAQVRRFTSECWVPARARWKYRIEKFGLPADVRATLNDMPGISRTAEMRDMDHIDSQMFLRVPGFYSRCKTYMGQPGAAWCPNDNNYMFAMSQVPGFEGFHSADDPQTVALPSCYEWWMDPQRGLRSQLLAMANPSGSPLNIYGNNTEAENKLIRALLTRGSGDIIPNDYAYYTSAATGDSWLSSAVRGVTYAGKQFFGVVGTATESVAQATKMNLMLQALPMIQALVLFGIYALLPWVLIFGRFSGAAVFAGGMAIFTVKFWSALWAMAWWLDQNLIEAMFPGVEFWNLLGGGGAGTKRMLLDMLTVGMYLGLPFIWTVMMGWAGIQAISRFDKINAAAGDQGAGAVGGASSRAGSSASGLASTPSDMAMGKAKGAIQGGVGKAKGKMGF